MLAIDLIQTMGVESRAAAYRCGTKVCCSLSQPNSLGIGELCADPNPNPSYLLALWCAYRCHETPLDVDAPPDSNRRIVAASVFARHFARTRKGTEQTTIQDVGVRVP